MRQQLHVDYLEARDVLVACSSKADAMGVPVSICILDGSGHPVLTARLDGAPFQTADVARGKALTAVMMRQSSKAIEDVTLERLTLATFDDGRLPIQGGLPLIASGVCVGAVAASGGTPDQDEIIAEAGASAFARSHV
jgi:uncharacterized protein GlcG (DUF336 family)